MFRASLATSANISGIIQHDSSSVWDQTDTGLQGVFGVSQVNTGLFPATPGQALVATLGPPVLALANLSAVTGWISGGTNQATFGTAVGLNLDAVTRLLLLRSDSGARRHDRRRHYR